MTNTCIIISITVFCLVFAGLGCTKEASGPEPDNPAGAEGKLKRFTGEITNVDLAAHTIVVKRTKDEGTFDVSALGNARAIKIGKKVTVSYYEQGGNKIAKSVKPAKTKRRKKQSKPSA